MIGPFPSSSFITVRVLCDQPEVFGHLAALDKSLLLQLPNRSESGLEKLVFGQFSVHGSSVLVSLFSQGCQQGRGPPVFVLLVSR